MDSCLGVHHAPALGRTVLAASAPDLPPPLKEKHRTPAVSVKLRTETPALLQGAPNIPNVTGADLLAYLWGCDLNVPRVSYFLCSFYMLENDARGIPAACPLPGVSNLGCREARALWGFHEVFLPVTLKVNLQRVA
ncbi:hypothetical protein NDU88_000612 [Pleurodeles waltl]|uniref:Uncharacterized protein n=1 Tax=Pleurodeles waltl TaxID=8319 RepID=A0AAV7P1C6_PLEWA|nr:hypothetical protein NDU88_000612 [Pleurodeles waltl]